MKKTLTKLWMGITLSTSIITFAQTGNVGVNTTTPGSTLDVRGSFAAQYTAVTAAAYAMSATDFFVAYNGTADAAFTLPAAMSGTGNFKGRMYTVKNNTSFTVTVSPAGAETINGNTSVSIGAGQSAQFVNTGLTGAAVTWELVSGSGSSLVNTGDYIMAKPTVIQSNVGVGTDIQFGTTLASKNITNSAGVFTLKAGKTYQLSCQLHGYNFSVATTSIFYTWVNALTNVQIPSTVSGLIHSLGNYTSTTIGGQPEASGIYTPSTDVTVKVRITNSNQPTATFSLYDNAGFVKITQIDPGSNGNGSGSGNLNTASNGLTAVSDEIKLGGNLGETTTISNNGNTLSIAGSASTTTFTPTGNVGINSSVPGSTFDVKGSFAVQYNDVTAAAYALSATDVFVSYSGAADGTFTLPAAISGAGNFKGRLYKIKNNSSFNLTVNPAGSETINGNTSITIGAGQSAEFVSTGLAGATSTWVVLNGSGSSTAGAGDYILALPSAGQTAVGTGSDLQFGTIANKNITNTAGVFTLKAGKTYMLSCQLHGYDFTVVPNGYITYQWVNALTNAVIPTTVQGILDSIGSYTSTTIGGQPETRGFITPTADMTVKVRIIGGSSNLTIHPTLGSVMITQIGNN